MEQITLTCWNKVQSLSNIFKMKKISALIRGSLLLLLALNLPVKIINALANNHQLKQQATNINEPLHPFPGVSRDLASFCADRSSLPIDLASMIVHVKRNVSFNYKLYLFSADHVFQTGQVIPRDDFRIHSFPVKYKRLEEFWPKQTATFNYQNSSPDSLSEVSSQLFDLKQFLQPVQLNPRKEVKQKLNRIEKDNHFLHDPLPGDDEFISHDVGIVVETRAARAAAKGVQSTSITENENINKFIHFDRDDQFSIKPHRDIYTRTNIEDTQRRDKLTDLREDYSGDTITPVGSFSSFHPNLTYLVRKDFGQMEPKLLRIQVDASKFEVNELILISDGIQNSTTYPQNGDYDFLQHKLLRDINTRITAINQIYEDWITRNFYTLVYVQRKLDETNKYGEETIVNDRLVFRGTSMSLLGADQLDYNVKAATFVTEKNGLHYYLEFLTTNKFYLGAVDWSKRPFRIIDSHHFPMKATQTQLDNQELLLCPPAVCFSNQPVDEIITYGRMNFKLDETVAKKRSLSEKLTSNSSMSRAANRMFDNSQLQARLHLRDWVWVLSRSDIDKIESNTDKQQVVRNVRPPPTFNWRYELARRNDIKVKPDSYGYVLTGHEIDASYRINNELYLIMANHLISINYTMPNETVTGSQPIGDEFYGLSSTLIDPITGAFYDRNSNRIYFFKGDRFVGYNFANKKPLDDFVLGLSMEGTTSEQNGNIVQFEGGNPKQLVSSLPVVEILGRQHQVDAVYHDPVSDLVFIISGMKFYSFEANEFKDGSFKPKSGGLPQFYCINQHLLKGCNFDRAFQNPCQDDDDIKRIENEKSAKLKVEPEDKHNSRTASRERNFIEEQQNKLRSIASRSGLLGLLVENTLLSGGAPKVVDPLIESGIQEVASEDRIRERIIVYLLLSMVAMTILITLIVLGTMFYYTRQKLKPARTAETTNNALTVIEQSRSNPRLDSKSLYMSNQQQNHSRRASQYPQGQALAYGRPVVSDRAKAVVVTKSRRRSDLDNSVL